jgi:phosphomevalonate kinase|tara:strand:+ start:2503 stop:2751 length:249 start_codon:yes stop_codon:yes gene_type:complete
MANNVENITSSSDRIGLIVSVLAHWNKNLPECLKTTDENDNMFILTQDDLAELNEVFETLPAEIRTKLIDVFVNSHIPSIEK